MISWPAALRLYAKQTGSYILPKKGSAAYDAVKKLQMETEDAPEHATAKRGSGKKAMAKKAKAEGAKVEGVAAPGITSGKVSKKKAPTAKGGASEVTTDAWDSVLPPAAKLTQIDNEGVAAKSQKVVDPESKPEKKVKGTGITRAGKNVVAEVTSDLVNSNTGMSAVVSAQLADQKEELGKALKVAKKTPKVVLVGDGSDKTIDGLKSDDPKAIEGKAPFSIQALRNKLLC